MSVAGESEFESRLKCILKAKDCTALDALLDEVSFYCFEETEGDNPIPTDVLNGIARSMCNPDLHAMEGGHRLLYFIETEWGRCAPTKWAELLPAIEATFSFFTDWMCYHVLAEILGRFMCSQASLASLSRLARRLPELPRAFVPLGFESLARAAAARDPNLSREALNRLVALGDDPSVRVQEEVHESLRRLQQVGGN